MRKIGVAFILVMASACSPASDVPIATAAADSFHQQLNAGAFDAIYANSDRLMKNAGPAKGLTELLSSIHNQLGDFKSAEAPGWNDQVTTNGHFVTLIYQSKYARGSAEENFVFRIDAGSAKLVRYHISAQAAQLK